MSGQAPRSWVAGIILLLGLGVALIVLVGAAIVRVPSLSLADSGPVPVASVGGAQVDLLVCNGVLAQQPDVIVRNCARSRDYLGNLQWSSWGGPVARATGSYFGTNCGCTKEPLRRFPVRVELDSPATVDRRDRYTRVEITFPSARPRSFPSTGASFAVEAGGLRLLG